MKTEAAEEPKAPPPITMANIPKTTEQQVLAVLLRIEKMMIESRGEAINTGVQQLDHTQFSASAHGKGKGKAK